MIRVGAYIRVSSLKQAEGFSLEDQKKRIEGYIKSRGDRKLVKIYQDEMSGTVRNRPELTALMTAIEGGKIDEIVVISLDRFGRSNIDLQRNVRKIINKGVGFISLREMIDFSTPVGKVVLAVIGSLAEMENEIRIERITGGKQRKLESGEKNIFPNPRFPLIWSKDKKTLVPDPKKMPIFKKMLELRIEEGYSYRRIAKELNVLFPGEKWSLASLQRVLNDRCFVEGRTPVKLRSYKRDEDGKVISTEILVETEVEFEPIISEEVFQKLRQTSIQNASFSDSAPIKKPSLLTK